MAKGVLDASAALAFIQNEPGGNVVNELAGKSAMSAVNLEEVSSRLYDFRLTEAQIDDAILSLRVILISFDVDQARIAARLRNETRFLGLSLGDRACLALARRLKLPVFTADRRWKRLDIGVDVRLIR